MSYIASLWTLTYLAGLISPALCCMQTGTPTSNTGATGATGATGQTSKPQVAGPYQRCGGSGTPSPAKTGYFDRKGGGPIQDKNDLNCDFDSDCCWTNEQAPADQLEWLQGSGSVDSSAWSNCFGTSKTPSGNYLVLPVDAATKDGDNGQWYSCSIACADDKINVTLKHWQTDGVKIKVCEKDAFDSTKPLSNCKTLSQGPGPDTVSLPKCQFCDIVIMATGFQSSNGGMAAIDDIKVKVPLCTNKTTTRQSSVTPGGGGACPAIACTFESGTMCGLGSQAGAGPNGTAGGNWGVQSGRTGNRDTGVTGAGEGQKYLATQLAPGQSAVLSSGDLSNTEIAQEGRVLVMKYFEATDGIVLQGCKDDLNNCQDISNPGVSVADRGWQTAQVQIPPGTKKVLLVAKNTGSNLGAVGIDDMTLARAVAPSNVAGQSYCPPKRRLSIQ